MQIHRILATLLVAAALLAGCGSAAPAATPQPTSALPPQVIPTPATGGGASGYPAPQQAYPAPEQAYPAPTAKP